MTNSDAVIAVHWNDATQHSGYFSGEAALELVNGDGGTMVSVGYVIANTQEYMLLAQTRNKFKWGDILRIPKDCVIDIAALTPPANLAPNWVNERDKQC